MMTTTTAATTTAALAAAVDNLTCAAVEAAQKGGLRAALAHPDVWAWGAAYGRPYAHAAEAERLLRLAAAAGEAATAEILAASLADREAVRRAAAA